MKHLRFQHYTHPEMSRKPKVLKVSATNNASPYLKSNSRITQQESAQGFAKSLTRGDILERIRALSNETLRVSDCFEANESSQRILRLLAASEVRTEFARNEIRTETEELKNLAQSSGGGMGNSANEELEELADSILELLNRLAQLDKT